MSSIISKNEELIGGNDGVTAHVCEICGVNQSSRGKPFTSAAEVWQHKRTRQKSAKPAPAGRVNHQVQFCPHCGFNLQVVHAAMDFVNGSSPS